MIDLKKVVIKEKKVDTILTKSNLPIAGYSINPYVGCPFGCEYCYATFMKRFTGHKEDWGMFLDVKMWDKIKNPEKYKSKTMIVGSVTDGYNYFEAKYKRTRAFLEEMHLFVLGSGRGLHHNRAQAFQQSLPRASIRFAVINASTASASSAGIEPLS